MNYYLPKSVYICEKEYKIRSDYRAILDICSALSDPDLTDNERAEAVLTIFYPDFDEIPQSDYQEAIHKCFWFLRGGEEERQTNQQQLVSWEQDFGLICPPISRIIGRDIRGMEYLHWWSYLAAYMEIGDCLFAQVVSIRAKKAKGKSLDKQDREFYRHNRDLIDIKKPLTESEQGILKEWM